MFVNKIGVSNNNIGFKGIEYVKNDVGDTLTNFYHDYDPETETCEVHIFRDKRTENFNYRISATPEIVQELKPGGVKINLREYFADEEPVSYYLVRKDKKTGKVIWQGPDTGVKQGKHDNGEYGFRVNNNFHLVERDGKKYYELQDPTTRYTHTLLTRKNTTPFVNGAAYLVIPDSLKPTVKFRPFGDPNVGEITEENVELQKFLEGIPKTFSNTYGGSIAGLIAVMDYLQKHGITFMVPTPFTNGDNISSISYWQCNNMQPDLKMGNMENYAEYRRQLLKHSMADFYDATLTSESLQGIHVNYFMRWNGRVPLNEIQSYYHFRMPGAKDDAIGLGIVPRNMENLRFKPINPKYLYEEQSDGTYKKVPNPEYNPNKEERVQFFDNSLVTEEQAKDYKNQIKYYDNLEKNNLRINSHDDTILPYVITPPKGESIDRGIQLINELNKKNGRNIKLDSPEAAVIIASFSNAKITRKTEGGAVTWDANTDMFKFNYQISAYDEKILQGIKDRSKRYYEQKLIERGNREVQDMGLQVVNYWAQTVKDIQVMYYADVIRNAKTVEAIHKLVDDKQLPEQARKITSEEVNNILNGYYKLAPKGVLLKDDVTVKSMMKLPLDSLEFADDTVGVLSTSFFSNRATSDETVGKSRFELMKENNPHLVEPYAKVYTKVNNMFANELKNFAHSIIEKVNTTSNVKLLSPDGNYTEFGEYVMELVGKDIAKFALLKALGGEYFKTQLLKNGEITYDYKTLKEETSLKSLGIDAHNPQEEALNLKNKIEKGLKNLSDSDINFVADSISKRIEGKDTASFRFGEALYYITGLGFNVRIDAAKDLMDTDSVRNRDLDFDDYWSQVIAYWSKANQVIKNVNPHAISWGEFTDVPDVIRTKYGIHSTPYEGKTNIGSRFNGEPDAMTKFFNETGITSEPGYSYFFTDLMTSFTRNFEDGEEIDELHNKFKEKLDLLMETRSLDYLRHFYTFVENQDKQRLLDGLALDMKLFRAPIIYSYDNGKANFDVQHDIREDVIKALSGASTLAEVPIELRLNVDNNDYFMNVSSRAAAMTKLLVDVINEQLKAPEEDKRLLKDALIDLANGNFGVKDAQSSITHINIKELSSLENALNEILNLSGMSLTDKERKEIIDKINSMDISDFLVHGNFNWGGPNSDLGEKNRKYLEEIMGSSADADNYNIYTVQLARLVKKGYAEVKGGSASSLDSGLRKFVEKFNNNTVNANKTPFIDHDDFNKAQKKNAYAARDIDEVLRLAFDQVEVKTGRRIQNQDGIQASIYKSAIEPAVQKAAMIMEFLGGLFGTPTMNAGTELGLTGYEDKSRNNWLGNRNVVPWTKEEQRKYIQERLMGALSRRNDKDLAALNNGTPWGVEVKTSRGTQAEIRARIYEINDTLKNPNSKLTDDERRKLQSEKAELIRDVAKVAYSMSGADGSMVITMFNAADIEHDNHFDYFAKYGLNTEADRKKFFADNNVDSINPENKYVPIQKRSEIDALFLSSALGIAAGTVFVNANSKDKTKYVIKDIDGRKALVREDGKKIVMDGLTAKNGVMMFKKVIKKIAFKGSNMPFYNNQYNIVPNPYKKSESIMNGEKLSIVSKG